MYAVVRVMKALAAASIRQSERAVESLAEYNRTIESGLQIVLRNRAEAVAADTPPGQRWGIIVFGSDQGMCGSFNEQVASFALDEIDALAPKGEDRTVLVVGARLVGRLEDAGCAVGKLFALPGTVAGITSAVQDVLLEVEELRGREGVDQLLLVHHRPGDAGGSRPGRLQLLPIDRAWLRSLAARNWDSPSLPTFTMDWHRLFSALIRQHLFVALYRAFAESMASENISRLASMQAAEKNIESHLSRLTVDYHQGRQQSITEELLDIVAGFETLTREKRRKAGGREGAIDAEAGARPGLPARRSCLRAGFHACGPDRRHEKGGDEDRGEQKHDGRRRGAVDEEGEIDAEEGPRDRDRYGERQHGAEPLRQKEGDGARRDQHGDCEDDADCLQRADDGQRDQGEQPVMQQADPQADRSRLCRVEGVQQEIPPFDDEDAGRDRRDERRLGDVAEPDAQHVAEQDVVEMHLGLDFHVEHQSKAEHAGNTMPSPCPA